MLDPEALRADTYKYILDKDIGSAAVVHIATKVANNFGVHNVGLLILPWMCILELELQLPIWMASRVPSNF